MGSEEGQHIVRAWSHGGVLLESYRYAPGHAAETPRHSHGDYQLCFSLNFPGEYRYRGESHAVPVGSLTKARSSKTKDPGRSIIWPVSVHREGACRARRREKIPAKGARYE